MVHFRTGATTASQPVEDRKFDTRFLHLTIQVAPAGGPRSLRRATTTSSFRRLVIEHIGAGPRGGDLVSVAHYPTLPGQKGDTSPRLSSRPMARRYSRAATTERSVCETHKRARHSGRSSEGRPRLTRLPSPPTANSCLPPPRCVRAPRGWRARTFAPGT
jgi:hypothetical protein